MRFLKDKLLLILLLFSINGFGQMIVQFVPEVHGNSIDGLMNARIFNNSGSQNIRLTVTVTEDKTGKVVVITTPIFRIGPGNNSIPSIAIKSSQITTGANAVGNFIRKNGTFPQGGYNYDFAIMSSSSSQEIIADQTYSYEVVPPAPFDLIEPFNRDQICEKRPLLTWQPSLPQILGMQYEVLLTEIKGSQSPVEALNYNLPIVNQKGVSSNMLFYPPISKELSSGKKYAWQVTAYKDQTVINRSEVWEFKVDCQDSISAIKDLDFGYRDIENLVKGNFYIAEGFIRFSMINSYAEQKLRYGIVCTTDPKSKIKNLPVIKLKRGQNKVNIDLRNNFSFKDGYSYIMTAYLPDGTPKMLRFIYKNIE
ncbi:DUF928 domain-containing protein [Pedobacter sp. MW01-1-1]|uniref:DUF928 domain-containing protein n=1 Tax=Pedobacter sp. MW01-1-1 TaxID=3383027 RepID=UPI003FED7648